MPEFEYYPYSCFLKNDLCYINTKEDLKRIFDIQKVLFEVAKENTNVFLFDPYKSICNLESDLCAMYQKDKNLLYFRDDDHLSVEGSEYLSKSFKIFLKESFN